MHIVTTHCLLDDTCWISIREPKWSRRYRSLDHKEGREHEHQQCFLSPPKWTWWIGFGYHAFLGTLLWNLGQAAKSRVASLRDRASADIPRDVDDPIRLGTRRPSGCSRTNELPTPDPAALPLHLTKCVLSEDSGLGEHG